MAPCLTFLKKWLLLISLCQWVLLKTVILLFKFYYEKSESFTFKGLSLLLTNAKAFFSTNNFRKTSYLLLCPFKCEIITMVFSPVAQNCKVKQNTNNMEFVMSICILTFLFPALPRQIIPFEYLSTTGHIHIFNLFLEKCLKKI